MEDRLAACVNRLPGVRSTYRWQGAVHDDAEVLLPSHGPPFRKDNKILKKAIDRLTQYQYMADFGTCAIGWPLLDEWEVEVTAGKMPDLGRK